MTSNPTRYTEQDVRDALTYERFRAWNTEGRAYEPDIDGENEDGLAAYRRGETIYHAARLVTTHRVRVGTLEPDRLAQYLPDGLLSPVVFSNAGWLAMSPCIVASALYARSNSRAAIATDEDAATEIERTLALDVEATADRLFGPER